MKIAAVALNTFREAVRNRVIYSAVFFALLLIAVSAFFGTVSIGDQIKVIKNFGLFALSFFGAVIAILSGVSLLHKELRQKTVFNILAKPVSRWQFIAGKYFGLLLTVHVLIAVMGIALVSFAWFFERRFDLLLFQAVFFVLLEMSIVAAVTIFFSSMAVTITLTGLFSFGTYLAGRSIGYLGFFFKEGDGYPPALLKTLEVFDAILPDLAVFDVTSTVVHGSGVSTEYLLGALVYCICYCVAALLLAMAVFSRRELV